PRTDGEEGPGRRAGVEPRGSVKIVRLGGLKAAGWHGLDPLRQDVDGAVAVPHFPLNDEETFRGDEQPLTLEEPWFHDRIGDAGLVFQADEDDSLGGTGTLTADDIPGNAHETAIWCLG